jgi:hypothetical protein
MRAFDASQEFFWNTGKCRLGAVLVDVEPYFFEFESLADSQEPLWVDGMTGIPLDVLVILTLFLVQQLQASLRLAVDDVLPGLISYVLAQLNCALCRDCS